MKRLTTLALLLTCFTIAPMNALSAAQVDSAELTAGLAQLNATLLEMKELLSMQVETQGLDLLLKRSELVSSQAGQLENMLRSAESTRTSLEDQLLQMVAEQEMMEEQIRSGAMDADEVDAQAYTRRVENRIEQTRSRLRKVESEVIALQSRLDTKQRDLEDWQELIDRRLSNI
jgi:flagellar biosynthesis chaperone FliJ